MRACARLALIATIVSASLGLAGCSSLDELRDAISRWLEKLDSGAFSDGRGRAFPDDVPHKAPVTAPKRMPKEEAGKAPGKDQPARQLQRRETVELPRKRPSFDATEAASEAAKPPGAEAPPAPPEPETAPAPGRLRTLWPEAPAPGTFSR
jgi:hypothetical protein